jgi:hypothetical protein
MMVQTAGMARWCCAPALSTAEGLLWSAARLEANYSAWAAQCMPFGSFLQLLQAVALPGEKSLRKRKAQAA